MDSWPFRNKVIKNIKKAGIIMKILLGVIVGSVIGFAVGYLGRCSTGTCPLTSNPWVSTIVGAGIGLMATIK